MPHGDLCQFDRCQQRVEPLLRPIIGWKFAVDELQKAFSSGFDLQLDEFLKIVPMQRPGKVRRFGGSCDEAEICTFAARAFATGASGALASGSLDS